MTPPMAPQVPRGPCDALVCQGRDLHMVFTAVPHCSASKTWALGGGWREAVHCDQKPGVRLVVLGPSLTLCTAHLPAGEETSKGCEGGCPRTRDPEPEGLVWGHVQAHQHLEERPSHPQNAGMCRQRDPVWTVPGRPG